MDLQSGRQEGLNPFIQLAPMEGVLDWSLRELLSEIGGVDRMVTEFVRVTDKLLPEHVFKKYCPELDQGGRTRTGTPVFVQLLGGDPTVLAENAAQVATLGAPGVDLNFGCPAKTVNRHDGGAVLLKNPERLFHIVSAVRRAVSVPVTAKVRLGFADKTLCREIAAAAFAGGAAHLVVHARTKMEMYQPPAHWEYIGEMASATPSLRFVANGEIWSADDYRRCEKTCGVSDIALGRGLVRNPLLAAEIRRSLRPDLSLPAFSRASFLHRFYSMTRAWRGEIYALARLKQILRYWSAADLECKMWFERVKIMQRPEEVAAFFTPPVFENCG